MKTKGKWLLSLAGALLGAAGGYAYYHFVGCANGCPLKSNALFMSGYGGLLGLFAFQTGEEIVRRLRHARLAEKTRAD